MIAGPYGSGTATEIERQANLHKLNEAALSVFRAGHIPVIGVNNALPVIALAGSQSFNEIMMPLSLALADRCDCCLRAGGPSKGADQEVERFKAADKSVYYSIDQVP